MCRLPGPERPVSPPFYFSTFSLFWIISSDTAAGSGLGGRLGGMAAGRAAGRGTLGGPLGRGTLRAAKKGAGTSGGRGVISWEEWW